MSYVKILCNQRKLVHVLLSKNLTTFGQRNMTTLSTFLRLQMPHIVPQERCGIHTLKAK